MAERELNERSDGQPKVGASTPTDKPAAAPGHRHQARPHPYSRSRAPSIRTRHPIAGPTPERPRRALAARVGERLRLARDLHDGVRAEMVSLLIRLKRAEEDPATPPAIARTLASLGDHTTAALASVREIALGIYPPALAGFGVVEALRALAGRASTTVIVSGTAPGSSDEAETAVYFSCSEAIQDVAKHPGHAARVRLSLHHDTTLGGAVQLDSHPGRGTVLTLSLPWPWS